MYFWLCWVLVAAWRLSLVVVSGGYSWLRCTGFLSQRLLLWSMGSRCLGSVVAAHGLSSCDVWAWLPHGTWDLLRPGIEPVSPALAGNS